MQVTEIIATALRLTVSGLKIKLDESDFTVKELYIIKKILRSEENVQEFLEQKK